MADESRTEGFSALELARVAVGVTVSVFSGVVLFNVVLGRRWHEFIVLATTSVSLLIVASLVVIFREPTPAGRAKRLEWVMLAFAGGWFAAPATFVVVLFNNGLALK